MQIKSLRSRRDSGTKTSSSGSGVSYHQHGVFCDGYSLNIHSRGSCWILDVQDYTGQRDGWWMIAFITCKRSLVPLLEGLCTSNPCRFEFSVFLRKSCCCFCSSVKMDLGTGFRGKSCQRTESQVLSLGGFQCLSPCRDGALGPRSRKLFAPMQCQVMSIQWARYGTCKAWRRWEQDIFIYVYI